MDDHDLDLQIFRNNPNCNWEVSSSYKLHAATFSSPLPLSIPISPSPQLPSPGGRVAVVAVVPRAGSRCWSAGAAPAAR